MKNVHGNRQEQALEKYLKVEEQDSVEDLC